eukprot:2670406-Amphidinium_carterae.1
MPDIHVLARIVYAVMTVEGSSWNGCPYEEEAMSILVGQVCDLFPNSGAENSHNNELVEF